MENDLPKYEKLERDGLIAVLYSPEYGGTWSYGVEALAFDKEIIELVLLDDIYGAVKLAIEKYKDEYDNYAFTAEYYLRVEWIPKGTRFKITEYDGSESVEIIGPDYGYVA